MQTMKDDLFFLIGFLLTSARGLAEEPQGFGPFRLLDAAARVMEIMAHHGIADDFVLEALGRVNTERLGPEDEEADQRLVELVEQLSWEFAERLNASSHTKTE